MSVNDRIADRLTEHSLDLLRIEAGLQTKVVAILKDLEGDIVKQLTTADIDGVTHITYQQKRLAKLLPVVRDTIDRAMRDATKISHTELIELAKLQSAIAAITINEAVHTNLIDITLDRHVLESLARNTLIEGAPSAEWWKRQGIALRNRFTDEMRSGVLAGEHLGDLVRRIRGRRENQFKDGIMLTTTRNAENLARTSVQTVANAARMRLYQENVDVIKGKAWASTLDTTTTDICKALDGLIWDLFGNPIGHDKQYPGHIAHWGCRSTQIPVLRSWDELTQGNIPRNLRKKLDAIPPRTRASMDGQVSTSLNYEDWLKTKPEVFQKGVLGENKWQLWQSGKLRFIDLIDQRNHPLTVEQLRKKYAGGKV